MFFGLNIVCVCFNLLAPEIFVFPSKDHFEGPERSPSSWSKTAHPRDMSSSHLMFVKLMVCCRNFTLYFTETVWRIIKDDFYSI